MEPAELSTMLKPFLCRSQKTQWKENHTVATLWELIPSGLDRFFFWFPSKKAVFHYLGQVFKLANEALHPSLKDLARQGLNSFTKHKRPISSKDLGDLYAANQAGSECSRKYIRHGLTPFSTSEREAVKTNARWNPVTFSSKQQAGWSTSSQAREWQKISPPSSATDFTNSVFHWCKFWDCNTFLSRQVFEKYVGIYEPKAPSFEFLIQGALRELISHDSLSNVLQSEWK